jgi:uncharacterized protein DUF3551
MQKATLAMLSLGVLLSSVPASAQTYGGGYPVCLQTFGRFSHIDCSYASIGQCRASAAGRAAQCITNPYFAGQAGPGRRHKYRAY